MGNVWQQPSPSDYDRWVAMLIQGDEPSAAAKSLGFTCSAFRRNDPERHAEALQIGQEARAHYADEKAEQWALADDADDKMRERWLRRWQPAFRDKSAVDVNHTGEVNAPDVAAAIERFNALADAALGAATRTSEISVPRGALERGES